MTTSVAPPRVLSNKATLIGVAVPTPTRKDGTPIPLADTPPEGFHKVKVPTKAPPAVGAPLRPRSEAPQAEPARVLTQQAIDAIKATSTPTDPDKVDASTRVTRRDMPIQGARRNLPAAPPGGLSSSTRLLAVSAALAALVLGGRWFFMQSRGADEAHEASATPPTGVQVVPPADKAPSAVAPTSPEAAPGTGAAAPEETAGPPPPEAASAAPLASAAPAATTRPEGTRVVIVKLSPSNARLFRKGKPVGSSPVTVELGPDEKKRSFEVGAPGFVTRKLVVDGSKPEIFIGLKPR
jgi:hypothetical protein